MSTKADAIAEPEWQLRILGAFFVGADRYLIADGSPPVNWHAFLASNAGESLPRTPSVAEPRRALLVLRDRRVRFHSWAAGPLLHAWQSSNGTAYLTEGTGRVILVCRGEWRAERLASDADLQKTFDFRISGIGGINEAEDEVYVSATGNRLFRRASGRWTEIIVPARVQDLGPPAVLSRNAVYFVSRQGLAFWNGSAIVELDFPEDDDPFAVVARPNGDVFITGRAGLHVWSESAQDWAYFAAGVGLRPTIADFRGRIYLASAEAILAWKDGAIGPVLEADCAGFMQIADDLIARGPFGGAYLLETDGSAARLELSQSLLPRDV